MQLWTSEFQISFTVFHIFLFVESKQQAGTVSFSITLRPFEALITSQRRDGNLARSYLRHDAH